MLHEVSGELLEFRLDQLQVLPFRGDPAAAYATVETIVRRRDESRLHVSYSLHRDAMGWKIYGLAFAGVSYLVSFRQDFGEEIEQKGLDELVSRLDGMYGGGATSSAAQLSQPGMRHSARAVQAATMKGS